MVEEEEKLCSSMSALAILTCRPNSHPFQERHISVDELIKIGRSVARARPAANNGIFDCKVLSRHHAVLWYDNNQFYLQDTKSSNGTFINNQRLCKGGEESPPKEVYSGDLIQFGVEVMENNRRGEKITHGCIIANITLYHPDGREAKPAYLYETWNRYAMTDMLQSAASPYLNTPCPPGITIQSQDLYQLAQFLQEALHRETMLEQKLAILQKLVQSTQESSEGGWQALIDEDKLLSRLEVLENQLHTYSKNHSDDALRQEIENLQEDKLTYETTAKESLRRVLQEKLEAVTKLTDLERSLSNTESECSHLKDVCEKTQEELQQLAKKYQDKLQEVQDLQDKLTEAEQKHVEESEGSNEEKQELLSKIEEMILQEHVLSAKIESLQADNDIAKEQSAGIKAKMESMKEINEDDKKALLALEADVSDTEIIPLNLKENEETESLEEKLKETQQQIEKYKGQIKESDAKLQESNDKIEQLQKELDMARMDSKQYIVKITSLEESLKLSDTQLNQLMENTLDDLKLQLKESRRQCESSNDLIHSLEGQIEQLESELNSYKTLHCEKVDVTLINEESNVRSESALNGVPDNHAVSSSPSSLSEEERNWTALLEEARDAQKRAEVELRKCKGQLQDAQQTAKQSHNEAEQLRNKVKHIQEELESEKKDRREPHGSRYIHGESSPRSDSFSGRQSAKSRAEFQALKEECANLRKRIQAIEAEMKMSRRENLQLSSEYNKLQESYKQLEALKVKLETNESLVRSNLTDAQKDAEQAKMELLGTSEDTIRLRAQCKEYSEQLAELTVEIESMSGNYRKLADRSKLLSFLNCMPLLMLLFAILLALYPVLEGITATTS